MRPTEVAELTEKKAARPAFPGISWDTVIELRSNAWGLHLTMADPGTSSAELAHIASKVPAYARRVVHVGCGHGELGGLLRAAGLEVHGVEEDANAAAAARRVLDSVVEAGPVEGLGTFEPGTTDCVVLSVSLGDPNGARAFLDVSAPLLTPEGAVLIVTPHSEGGPSPTLATEAIVAVVRAAGFEPYLRWDLTQDGAVPVSGAEDAKEGGRHLILAVRNTYDPLAHARALLLADEPGLSHEVLTQIPKVYLEDPQVQSLVAAEKEMCLLAWDRLLDDPQGRLERFHIGQALFFEATWRVTALHHAYHCHAEFWSLMGDDGMAARMLRSILHVAPNPVTEDQLAAYHPEAAPKPPDIVPPEWRPGPSLPRVLMITDDRPNHGLDVLYDGLHAALGPDNVVEYPWKPTLHGRPAKRFGKYPCLFDLPGEARSLDEVVESLRREDFDLVLFGDLEATIPDEDVRRLGAACSEVPVFVLDQLDDYRDNRAGALERLGVDGVAGYFKREKLTCYDYGPDAYPMPLAYAERYMPESLPAERPNAFFWAGQRLFGLRKLSLEYLESLLDVDLNRKYSQEEYARELRSSRIGLALFGFGFDTVRYWEVPAHGCMLLAERRPIVIPQDFRDGETAVLFDDLPDLEQKLRHYMDAPEECAAIGQAGHEHLKKFHTGAARARQLLGWVDHALGKTGAP